MEVQPTGARIAISTIIIIKAPHAPPTLHARARSKWRLIVNHLKRTSLASSSALALMLMAGIARAGDDPATATATTSTTSSEEPIEVIITAEYRKTNLQKTPVAVSVITADTLQTKAIENLRDATTRVPGLFIAPSALTYSTGSYYIRGIGETDSIANQTVGTYIDDVYISRPIGGTFDFNDVQDIEVLRGPQGTLYGRNSSAGAIKITTKLPDNTPTGFGEVSVGDHEATILRAGIGGPIVKDKLAGSLAVVKRYREGLVYDRTLGTHVGTIDTTGVRAKLNWTPTANSAYLLTAEAFDDKGDPTPLVPRIQPGGVVDPNVNYSETQIENHTKLTALSFRATWNLSDKSTLKFITSERQFKQPGWYDQDGSANKINVTYSDHRDLDYTGELQYLYNGDRLHLVAGIFALNDNFRSYRTNYSPLAIAALLPDRTYIQDSGEKTKNYSAYGQVTYDLTPRLHLIAGERYTYEAHNFIFTGNEQNASKQYLTTLYTITKPYQHWTSFTPKLGLNFEVTKAVATYLTYAEGFKAGGFDGRASSKAAAGLPYDPENVTTWEGGFKGDFFSHAVRINLAVYHNLIEGYQASVLDENNITHRINLGKVRTQGFELETRWRPIAGLNWQNNVSLLDTKVLTAGGATTNAALYDGKQVPNAPRWQYFSALDYDLPWTASGVWSVGAEYFFRTKQFSDLVNTPAAKGVSQEIVNLSASFRPDNSKWSWSLSVRNVFDRRFDQGGTAGNGVTSINATTFNDPRLVLLRARYDY